MAQHPNDGGPAFPLENPRQLEDGALFKQFPGMSLRDWFAGTVSVGYLAAHADPDCSLPKPGMIATWAYKVADAMLAERSKTEGR